MFTIDHQSRQPVYEQIIAQMERFILLGYLPPGEKIPSVRSLSVDISVNPNTIQKAYADLDRRGLILSLPGRGSFVSEKAFEILQKEKAQEALQQLTDVTLELKRCGIEKDQILSRVEEAYQKITEQK